MDLGTFDRFALWDSDQVHLKTTFQVVFVRADSFGAQPVNFIVDTTVAAGDAGDDIRRRLQESFDHNIQENALELDVRTKIAKLRMHGQVGGYENSWTVPQKFFEMTTLPFCKVGVAAKIHKPKVDFPEKYHRRATARLKDAGGLVLAGQIVLK